MKKSFVCISIMLLAAVACEEIINQLYPRTPGSDVVFGPSSRHGAGTKASYSGTLVNGYERIDWADGDTIGIFCNEASAPGDKYAGYFVIKDSITTSGVSSSSKIRKDPAFPIGLRWGTGVHKFSALCPAPGHGVSGTAVSTDSVTCVLPAEQTHSGITYRVSGNKSPLAKYNPKYLYLAGYGVADANDEDTPVALYFDPAVTTFEFTLQNAYESGDLMSVKQAGITTGSGNLAGKYKVRVAGIDGDDGTLLKSDVKATGIGESNTVTMNFSPREMIAKNDSLTFTLFAQPGNDITQLTFWLVDTLGVKRSFNFKYSESSSKAGQWVTFTAFHKSKIRGIMTPEGVGWTINTVPVITEWGRDDQDVEIVEGNVMSFFTPVVTTWVDEDKGHLSYSD